MDIPFGFGGLEASGSRQRAGGTRTPAQRRAGEYKRIRQGLTGGLNSGSSFGAMMGFMGLPWLSRGSDRKGGYAGPPSWVYATDFLGNFGGAGGGGGGGGGGTGGNDPGTDGDGNGGGGNGNGNNPAWSPIQLLYPPPIGTGAQWRNTMRYGA